MNNHWRKWNVTEIVLWFYFQYVKSISFSWTEREREREKGKGDTLLLATRTWRVFVKGWRWLWWNTLTWYCYIYSYVYVWGKNILISWFFGNYDAHNLTVYIFEIIVYHKIKINFHILNINSFSAKTKNILRMFIKKIKTYFCCKNIFYNILLQLHLLVLHGKNTVECSLINDVIE